MEAQEFRSFMEAKFEHFPSLTVIHTRPAGSFQWREWGQYPTCEARNSKDIERWFLTHSANNGYPIKGVQVDLS